MSRETAKWYVNDGGKDFHHKCANKFQLIRVGMLHCPKTACPLYTAPGYAYGLKVSGSKTCVCTYFGDGAAQEGDAHAAMNFASTLGCPVIFIWSVCACIYNNLRWRFCD